MRDEDRRELSYVGALPECEVEINTGRHEKAPVSCPCSRLPALHVASRTVVAFVGRSS